MTKFIEIRDLLLYLYIIEKIDSVHSKPAGGLIVGRFPRLFWVLWDVRNLVTKMLQANSLSVFLKLPFDFLDPVLVYKTVFNRKHRVPAHLTTPGSFSNRRVVAPGDVRTQFFSKYNFKGLNGFN